MNLIQELNQCNSIEGLGKFCDNLITKQAKFDGHSYKLPSGESLDFKMLSNKIINLHEKMVKSEEDKTKVALQVHELIFKLKSNTYEHCTSDKAAEIAKTKLFGKSSKLSQVTDQCKGIVRKSNEAMKNIMADYNKQASELNQKIMGNSAVLARMDGHSPFKEDLNSLEFLNHFLGVKWDQPQKEGMAPLPLCNTGEVMEAAAPKNLKPKECKSLGSLYQLTKELTEEVTINRGKNIEIFGKTTISSKEILKQLLELYKNQIKQDPYIKSDMYMQVLATLFELEKLCPQLQGNLPKEIQKIYETCLKGIQQDPVSMERIQTQYNALVVPFNDTLKRCIALDNPALVADRYQLSGEDIKTFQTLEFLGQFLEFPLTLEHLQGRALLPEIRQVSEKGDEENLWKARSDYNYYALLLNYQQHVQIVRDQASTLERKLASHSALTMNEEQIASMKKELNKLNANIEVLGPPHPEALVKSMIAEQKRLAKMLGIKLTEAQENGRTPYPVLGRELSTSQKKVPLPLIPKQIDEYNLFAAMINRQHYYREKKIKFSELQQTFRETPIERVKEIKSMMSEMETLDQEIREMEKGRFKKDITFCEEDRWQLWRMSVLLLITEGEGWVKLTPGQKSGQEDLPTIDKNQLPPLEKEQIEHLSLEGEKWSSVVQHWPEHWKKQLETSSDAISEVK